MLVSTMIKLRYCLFVCCVCLFVCLTEMHITDIYAYHFKGSVQSWCQKETAALVTFKIKPQVHLCSRVMMSPLNPSRSLRGYYCNLYEPPYLSVFAFMALLCYKKVHWVGLGQKLVTSDTLMRDLLIEALFVWSLCFSHALVLPTWSPNLLVA